MVETEAPPPIPPKPKITLQIPPYNAPRVPSTASTGYWGPPIYPPHFQGAPPQTAGAGVQPGGYYNPFTSMYQSKASDFMFRQFSDFKDFTMNTAKGGLSMGEKSAFWLYAKISTLSKRWFTHIFLFICVALYGVAGAALFTALEGPFEKREVIDIRKERYELAERVWKLLNTPATTDIQLWAGSLIKELQQFEVKVIESNNKGISDKYYEFKSNKCIKDEYLNYSGKTASDKKWTFWNAMFYSGTIYTTIDGETLP